MQGESGPEGTDLEGRGGGAGTRVQSVPGNELVGVPSLSSTQGSGPMALWSRSRRWRPGDGAWVGALTLLLVLTHCSRLNGTLCGEVRRGCVQIYNQLEQSVTLSAMPNGTVVELPAAIYGPNITSGLGTVSVDSTVGASTLFVVLDGGTAEANVTCTVSPAAWMSANPELIVGPGGSPVRALACEEW